MRLRLLAFVLTLLVFAGCGTQEVGAPAAPTLIPTQAAAPAIAVGEGYAASPALTALPADVAPTQAPPADIAPTQAPPAEVAPTQAPPAEVAPTQAPPAEVAPTQVPPTQVPPPPTQRPTVVPTPTPVYAPPVRITIDAIGMNRRLLSVGLDANRVPIVPDHDAGWYKLSAKPGSGNNIVFWGHVLRFRSTPNIAAPFAQVQDLAIGTPIKVTTKDGKVYTYAITQQVWAKPTEIEYILPTDGERLTLVSCIGDKVILDNQLEMTHRLITIAEPVK